MNVPATWGVGDTGLEFEITSLSHCSREERGRLFLDGWTALFGLPFPRDIWLRQVPYFFDYKTHPTIQEENGVCLIV